MRLRTLALAATAALALSACHYGRYGHAGVSIGYGGYYDDYGDPYYDDYYAYYRANPYWGWYNGYYYPGTGIYIYDRYRRPYRWNDYYRSYWGGRHLYWRDRGDWDDRRGFRDNWRDFDRRDWDRRDGDRRDRYERRRWRRDR